MAILSAVPPPAQQDPSISLTAAALSKLNISTTLKIPLDTLEAINDNGKKLHRKKSADLKRDSMYRREALLKGKEGSRRRQRWENANFLNIPNSQPPLPSDWEVRPTYPVHNVPYYLAPLWEAGVRHRAEEIAAEKQKKRVNHTTDGKGKGKGKGKVPQELREKMKRSRGAKTLLQDLESEIRTFIRDYERQNSARPSTSSSSSSFSSSSFDKADIDSEDEEIVFIGRDKHGNGITMSDEIREAVEEGLKKEKKIYEGLKGCKEGGFARWLVHCLGEYYGVRSWSETVGESKRAWVGIGETGRDVNSEGMGMGSELPRPLWGLV